MAAEVPALLRVAGFKQKRRSRSDGESAGSETAVALLPPVHSKFRAVVQALDEFVLSAQQLREHIMQAEGRATPLSSSLVVPGLEPSASSKPGPKGAHPSLPLAGHAPAAAGLPESAPPSVRTTRGGGAASTGPPVRRRDKAHFARKAADRAADVHAHGTLPLTPEQASADALP